MRALLRVWCWFCALMTLSLSATTIVVQLRGASRRL